MAKIYRYPDEVGSPPDWDDFETDKDGWFDDLVNAEKAWTEKVVEWAKKNTRSKNPLVGYVWRYGVADGYAQYVVLNTKPLELIHLPLGDAYQINDIVVRGLRVSDIQKAKKFDDMWKKKR